MLCYHLKKHFEYMTFCFLAHHHALQASHVAFLSCNLEITVDNSLGALATLDNDGKRIRRVLT